MEEKTDIIKNSKSKTFTGKSSAVGNLSDDLGGSFSLYRSSFRFFGDILHFYKGGFSLGHCVSVDFYGATSAWTSMAASASTEAGSAQDSGAASASAGTDSAASGAASARDLEAAVVQLLQP